LTSNRGLFWSRGLFVLTVACIIGWVFIPSPQRALLIVAGGLAAIGAGVLAFADVGGAGSDWARAQLRWQRRIPFYRSSADRTDPKGMSRMLGIATVGLGAFLFLLGVWEFVASS